MRIELRKPAVARELEIASVLVIALLPAKAARGLAIEGFLLCDGAFEIHATLWRYDVELLDSDALARPPGDQQRLGRFEKQRAVLRYLRAFKREAIDHDV